jgi:hypothetical protein
VAAGRNPRKWRRTRTPIEYLKSLQAADGSVRYSRTSAQTPVWVTAQALNGLEAKPYPLPPAPRQKARTATAGTAGASGGGESTGGTSTAGASTTTATTTTATTTTTAKAAKRAKAPTAAATPTQAGTSEAEIQTRPVAQTTTTTSSSNPAAQSDGEAGWWPFAFAVLLGIVILAGIRLAWRRG